MTTLERQAASVLQIMESTPGKWLNRIAIARQLGQSRVQIQLIMALDFLVLSNKLQVREMPTYAPSKFRYEFKLREVKAN
jgi:hypothetical protein